jgi:hypothetical protein
MPPTQQTRVLMQLCPPVFCLLSPVSGFSVSERESPCRQSRTPRVTPPVTRQNAPARAALSAACHSPKGPSQNPCRSSHLPQPMGGGGEGV